MHSYEEVRSLALEVLSGRIPSATGISQYDDLKIAVGEELQRRDGLPSRPPVMYPADSALDHGDACLLLEAFWDLFRDGIISLGINDANKEFPFFHVTARGSSLINGEQSYFLHDVSGFEKRIKDRVPGIDDTTLLYLKEALQAFRSGCILSSSVMLGVATEHTFLLLLEVIDKNPQHAAHFSAAQKESSILRKINRFKKSFDQNLNIFPKEIIDDFETQFLGIQSVIRVFRNESGHPSGQIVDREQAFVNLQLFVTFGRKAYQLMRFFK
jgi:hypothetical protein